MIPPSPSPVLANRVTMNLTNESLTNCAIKRGPLGDNDVVEFWSHILSLGDIIHQYKWRKVRWIFLCKAFGRVCHHLNKYGPLIYSFDDPIRLLIKIVHLYTYTDPCSV